MLVPGCGLARLAYDVASLGFHVDANDCESDALCIYLKIHSRSSADSFPFHEPRLFAHLSPNADSRSAYRPSLHSFVLASPLGGKDVSTRVIP